MNAREAKKESTNPVLNIEKNDLEETEHRITRYFDDNTIGIFSIYQNKPSSLSSKKTYRGQLKIIDADTFKPKGEHVIFDDSSTLFTPSYLKYRYGKTTLLKINGSIIFLHSSPFTLDIDDIHNKRIGYQEKSGSFDISKAIRLNHSCFAVPHLNEHGRDPMIFIFELQDGKAKIAKKIYLSRNHRDFNDLFGQIKNTDPLAKDQNAKLPFSLTNIMHLERLTDDSFIIQGDDSTNGTHNLVLKCNFQNDTITPLFSPFLNKAAVRVLNPTTLLCVGEKLNPTILLDVDEKSSSDEHKEISAYSQLWKLEEKEARLKLQEPLLYKYDKDTFPLTRQSLGAENRGYDNIQCLPGQIGFLLPPHYERRENFWKLQPTAIHLFGNEFVKELKLTGLSFTLPVMLDEKDVAIECPLTMVTHSGIAHSNRISLLGPNSYNWLQNTSLVDLVNKHKHHIRTTIDQKSFAQSVLNLGIKQILPAPVARIVTGYAYQDPIPASAILATPITPNNALEKLFQILRDDTYFTGSRADKMRALIYGEPTEKMLTSLKQFIAKKYEPKGFGFNLFGYDSRCDQEKILCQLFKEISDPLDLSISPHLEKLKEHWNTFHQLPRLGIWE